MYRERDPERPDPAEPSRERIRETLVERQIREAMEDGSFDDLPHRGRRLPIDDDSFAGTWALAHRMLKNAGVAPHGSRPTRRFGRCWPSGTGCWRGRPAYPRRVGAGRASS
jgi:hypothetical protein